MILMSDTFVSQYLDFSIWLTTRGSADQDGQTVFISPACGLITTRAVSPEGRVSHQMKGFHAYHQLKQVFHVC